ncbi:MAG: hypothetical protein A2007_00850 [Verrucomicrobia bacterium GWC2_42_7]|nr:MAG: hypothetical protein A2007_00850 [Verrucomicrobia bacterium GWC2_42_7]
MSFRLLLPANWIKNLSTLGPLGFWGKAPGTNGSIAGLLWYSMVFHFLTPGMYVLLLAISITFAIAICEEAEILFAKKDPSFVILDEFVAMPVCFIGLKGAMLHHPMWIFMLTGLLLFRFFDILKPLGIKKLQDLKGGLGVVIDDIAAAILTCLCLHVVSYFLM